MVARTFRSKPGRRLLGFAAVAALGLAACGSSEPATEAAGESAGSTVVAATLAGGEIDLAAEQGNDLLLWFWAPW